MPNFLHGNPPHRTHYTSDWSSVHLRHKNKHNPWLTRPRLATDARGGYPQLVAQLATLIVTRSKLTSRDNEWEELKPETTNHGTYNRVDALVNSGIRPKTSYPPDFKSKSVHLTQLNRMRTRHHATRISSSQQATPLVNVRLQRPN